MNLQQNVFVMTSVLCSGWRGERGAEMCDLSLCGEQQASPNPRRARRKPQSEH